MFENGELRYIDLSYFNIIKIMQEEDFIEIQSICTKDYWIIKKNKFFEERFPIILYHKHNGQKYYHRHWQCYKVRQCIDSIKSLTCRKNIQFYSQYVSG